MEITRGIAVKVLETVDAGLVKGKGEPIPGQMCVEAAVCFAMGLPHSDEPTCVSLAIRTLKIRLNDSDWSSNAARAKGMRRLALVQLGSAGTVDDNDFARRIAEMTVRKIVPIALRAAAALHCIVEHKTALEASAKLCETEGSQSAAESAAKSAAEAARAARAARAAEAVAEYAAIDTVLSDFAEAVVQVLIEMKAPGGQWLDLAPIGGDNA